jgi:hypothetical protein
MRFLANKSRRGGTVAGLQVQPVKHWRAFAFSAHAKKFKPSRPVVGMVVDSTKDFLNGIEFINKSFWKSK